MSVSSRHIVVVSIDVHRLTGWVTKFLSHFYRLGEYGWARNLFQSNEFHLTIFVVHTRSNQSRGSVPCEGGYPIVTVFGSLL